MNTQRLFQGLASYIEARGEETDQIDAARQELLLSVGAFVRERVAAEGAAHLVFVCTHNSRRSHMAQLWAMAAAEACGVPLRTYSGGTEATAFFPSAVEAVRSAGMTVDSDDASSNPRYSVRLGGDVEPYACWSKVFSEAPNPSSGQGAVMVCSSADAACPSVPGPAARFAVTYEDPKAFDNTPEESAAYAERCAQIAREMLFMVKSAV